MSQTVISAFRDATIDVLGTFGLPAQPGGLHAGPSAEGDLGGVRAVASLDGRLSGVIVLHCPRQLAQAIAGGILDRVDPSSVDLEDATIEFFSMLMGRANALFAPKDGAFSYSVPTAITGGRGWVPETYAEDAPRLCLTFHCQDHPLTIVILPR